MAEMQEEVQHKVADLLHELMTIQQERKTLYDQFRQQATHNELKEMFTRLASESEAHHEELATLIGKSEDDKATHTPHVDKFRKVWNTLPQELNEGNWILFLENIEVGEQATVEAYNTVINSSTEMPDEVQTALSTQKNQISSTYQLIKDKVAYS